MYVLKLHFAALPEEEISEKISRRILSVIKACSSGGASELVSSAGVPKSQGPGGSCPHGYTQSGSFCVPSQRGAQDAIPKPPNDKSPWGWTSSGDYCLRSASGR
jgi:hypothetical protein